MIYILYDVHSTLVFFTACSCDLFSGSHNNNFLYSNLSVALMLHLIDSPNFKFTVFVLRGSDVALVALASVVV